jgi:hypothetical protein
VDSVRRNELVELLIEIIIERINSTKSKTGGNKNEE